MDFERDPVHTPVMYTTQRLPASLTPLDVALAALLGAMKPAAAEHPPVAAQHGTTIVELKAWPSDDVAAVDGWALRTSDLVGASSYTPLPLGQAPVWVEAGDNIPAGCDCVLDEDSIERTGPLVQALAEAIPGQGIRRRGEEIGDRGAIADAWRAGDRADPAQRPLVRIVNVPGGALTTKLIAHGLRESHIDVVSSDAAARDTASIAEALDRVDGDLIIMVGGSGVGRTDAAVMALARCGGVIAHGLALQPGRTAAVGRIGGTPVIIIPGAPDQALAVWWTLALPALDRLTGRRRQTMTRPLARKIASGVGVAEVVLLGERQGAWLPLGVGDLALASVARADAWLLVPGGSEGYAAGTMVEAHMLGQ